MKRAIYIGIIIACLLVINSLLRSIYDLWHKQDLVVNAETQLEREKAENRKLKARLSYVKSPDFIESEARDKLFMVKPGESKILIPSELISSNSAKKKESEPNWKQWVNLLTGS